MKPKSVADIAVDVAKESECYCICWGYIEEIHEIANRASHTNIAGQHPLIVAQRVLNAIERRPDIFYKTRIPFDNFDSGERLCRCFWLYGQGPHPEYKPEDEEHRRFCASIGIRP